MKRKTLDMTPTQALDFRVPSEMEWPERERWHMTYAATPLNARAMRVDERTLYVHEALRYVNDILHDAVKEFPHISPRVFGHLEIAAQGALFSRIEENEQKTIPTDCDERSAELFMRACEGIASPDELLELLRRYPLALQSLELAKQTRVGDWRATQGMDTVMAGTLDYHDAYLRSSERTQNVRYSITRIDDTTSPEVATFVRKADQGVVIAYDGTPINVVQRDTYVVDLMQPDTAAIGVELHAWVRTPQTKEAMRGNVKVPYDGPLLGAFMDTQLATASTGRSSALVPVVRSYYGYASKRSTSA